MEKLSSPDGLVAVEQELISTPHQITRINKQLEQQGYDTELVHGIIQSFKPGRKNFVGGNYLPPEAVRKNSRAHISAERLDEILPYAKFLASQGVVLEHNGGFSLTADLDTISDPVLKEAAAYHLRKDTQQCACEKNGK